MLLIGYSRLQYFTCTTRACNFFTETSAKYSGLLCAILQLSGRKLSKSHGSLQPPVLEYSDLSAVQVLKTGFYICLF